MNPQAVDSLSKQTIALTPSYVPTTKWCGSVGARRSRTFFWIFVCFFLFICLLGIFLRRSHWTSRPSAIYCFFLLLCNLETQLSALPTIQSSSLSQTDVIPHITWVLSDNLMGQRKHRPCFPHWCPMLPPEPSGVEFLHHFCWPSLSIQCLELVLDTISLCNSLVFLQLFGP